MQSLAGCAACKETGTRTIDGEQTEAEANGMDVFTFMPVHPLI
jgi:hypothetical protein